MSWIVLLSLASVDKDDGELVAVLGIVAAAAPHPVERQIGRTGPCTAAARRQVAVSTCPGDFVQYSGRHQRLSERRLRCTCKKHDVNWLTPTVSVWVQLV